MPYRNDDYSPDLQATTANLLRESRRIVSKAISEMSEKCQGEMRASRDMVPHFAIFRAHVENWFDDNFYTCYGGTDELYSIWGFGTRQSIVGQRYGHMVSRIQDLGENFLLGCYKTPWATQFLGFLTRLMIEDKWCFILCAIPLHDLEKEYEHACNLLPWLKDGLHHRNKSLRRFAVANVRTYTTSDVPRKFLWHQTLLNNMTVSSVQCNEEQGAPNESEKFP